MIGDTMKQEITLKQLDYLWGTLRNISQTPPKDTADGRVIFKLAKIFKSITPDMEAYIDARNSIIAEYNKNPTESMDINPCNPEHMVFMNKLKELSLGTTEIDTPTIKYSELNQAYVLTIEQFNNLMPIIIDDSNEDE